MLINALEPPVQLDHQEGFVYSKGYRPVLLWYVSLKSLIHETIALVDRPAQLPSRSSIPGRVMPSFDQLPPFARK